MGSKVMRLTEGRLSLLVQESPYLEAGKLQSRIKMYDPDSWSADLWEWKEGGDNARKYAYFIIKSLIVLGIDNKVDLRYFYALHSSLLNVVYWVDDRIIKFSALLAINYYINFTSSDDGLLDYIHDVYFGHPDFPSEINFLID